MSSSLSTYERCLEKMFKLHRFGIILGLDTIRSMLAKLDNPQLGYRCIHLAGTNGKGSIASMLATVLKNAGFKVGLYTSPHLVKFNERIQINGQPISDDRVVWLYEKVLNANQGERQATFFEFATAMALYEFDASNVDWAIVETGMGGRLDATNIVSSALSIITNISLEHQAYLGDTLEKIAAEKAGIIKPNVPVVTGAEQKSVIEIITKTAQENRCPCYCKDKDFQVFFKSDGKFDYQGINDRFENLTMGLTGTHQFDNGALVLAACEVLKTLGVSISEDAIRNALKENHWPGRLEKVLDKPLVILDGAHNLAAVHVLSKFLKKELSQVAVTLVVGILDDKPYQDMLEILAPLCSQIILTQPKINRSLDPQKLLEIVEPLNPNVKVIANAATAVQTAIENAAPTEAVCIAGSLYLVGEAKEALAQFLKN